MFIYVTILIDKFLSILVNFCFDINFCPFLLAAIGHRLKADHCVKRYINEWNFCGRQIKEVSVQTAQYSLMANDNELFLAPLQLEYYRLEPSDYINIAFAARISVGEFVSTTTTIFIRKSMTDLLITQSVTDSDFDIVQGPPLNQSSGAATWRKQGWIYL